MFSEGPDLQGFLNDANLNEQAKKELRQFSIGVRITRNRKQPQKRLSKYAKRNHKLENMEFEKKYMKFMQIKELSFQIKQQLSDLKNISQVIAKHNGVVQAISKGQWPQIYAQLPNAITKDYSQEELYTYCLKNLFKYQFAILQLHRFKEKWPEKIMFLRTDFYHDSQIKQIFQNLQKGLQCYQKPMIVLRKGEDYIKINKELVCLPKIGNIFKNDQIDIRIQRPKDNGFRCERLANASYQMKVGDYIRYQNIYRDPQLLRNFKHSSALGEQNIFFGVNLDPKAENKDPILRHVYDSLSHTFLANRTDYDLLSYLDKEIPGCSSAQFYFKVQGVWTGGHQENINMCAVNINHGPDSSQWYAMQFEHMKTFREYLNNKYGQQLYLCEGLWYQQIQWFMKHEFPVRRIQQRKGDIVVLGPGTLHWVRSNGVALQSAWNIMPKFHEQIQRAFFRQKINCEINFPRMNVIPLRTILLRYMNHQFNSLKQQTKKLIEQKILEILDEQKIIIQQQIANEKLHSKNITIRYLNDGLTFCSMCKRQIFQYYCYYQTEQICVRCIKYKNTGGRQTWHKKYEESALNEFFDRIKKNDFNIEIDELCPGTYIGKVINCCKKQFIQHQLAKKIKRKAKDLEKMLDLSPQFPNKEKDSNNLPFIVQKIQHKQKAETKQSTKTKKLANSKQIESIQKIEHHQPEQKAQEKNYLKQEQARKLQEVNMKLSNVFLNKAISENLQSKKEIKQQHKLNQQEKSINKSSRKHKKERIGPNFISTKKKTTITKRRSSKSLRAI